MEQQTIEELKQEISLLQAEIETLKAKKSIAECIRESFALERPVRVLKRKVRHKTEDRCYSRSISAGESLLA